MRKLYLICLPLLAGILVTPLVGSEKPTVARANVGDTVSTDASFANVQHGYWTGRAYEFNIIKEEDPNYEVEFLRPSSSVTEVVMPESISYNGHDYIITKLAGNASMYDDYSFVNQTTLTSITLPSSLKTISQGAFIGCTSLPSIVIPDSVTMIEAAAFGSCSSLVDVIVTSPTPAYLASSAFNGCSEALKIHVPGSLVETYKSAWSSFAGKIEGSDVLEDILPDDFADNETYGWSNGNSKIYKNSESLLLDGEEILPLDTVLTSDGTASYYIDLDSNHYYSFYFTDGVLSKINLLGFKSSENGDYVAPKINPGKTHNHNGYVAWGDGEEESTSLPAIAGSYYLTKDITLSAQWAAPAGSSSEYAVTNICLNGHVIRYVNADAQGGLLKATNYAILNIFDCDTNTKHYFNKLESGLWVYAEDQSTPTEYFVTGGVLTGSTTYCILASGNGEVNVYGGNIVGNIGKGGSAIRAINGVECGVYGGLITGNVDSNSTGACGAVLANTENFSVGGSAKIYGNVNGALEARDLCSYGTSIPQLNIGTDFFAPEESMCVGVCGYNSKEKKYVLGRISVSASQDDAKYFFADEDDRVVRYNNEGYLEIANKTVGDLLPSNFPILTNEGIPGGVWLNDSDVCLACYEDVLLIFTNDFSLQLPSDNVWGMNVVKNGNNYQLEGSSTMVFVMSDGVLTSIQVSGFDDPYASFNGTFKHDHSIAVTHDGVAATCEKAGHDAYYECGCGKYFSDSSMASLIGDIDAWLGEDGAGYIAALGHDMVHHDAVSATCTKDGNVEYWSCENESGVYYADEACTSTLSSIVISKLGHKMTHHDAVAATCTKDGNVEYWSCSQCNKNFADEAGIIELTTVVASQLGHDYVITYTWNEDNTACVSKAECSKGDSSITNEATITIEDGYAVATFENELFETQRVKLPEVTEQNKGLSAGAIVGISVGSVVGVCLITYIVMFFIWKKNQKAFKFLTPSFKWINAKVFKD